MGLTKRKMREMRKDFRELGGKFELDKSTENVVWAVYEGVRIGYANIQGDWWCRKIHAVVMCFLVLQEYFDFRRKL